jgi:hypothetical protein
MNRLRGRHAGLVGAGLAFVVSLSLGALGGTGALAQDTVTVRLASLAQWVLEQHGTATPALVRALEAGVRDRAVFWWQRGRIARSSLAPKGVRLLVGEEAQALGGRGDPRPVALEYPRGSSAWTTVTLAGPGADDRAILEIGGEMNTVRQVLETFAVLGSDGALVRVALSVPSLVPSPGIPVTRRLPGPLPAGLPFGPVPGGIEVAVVRSTVDAVPDGAVTPGGLADAAPHPGQGSGDWREADRVLLRVPLAPATAPVAIVLGWKDRVLRPDPDAEFPVRAALPRPAGRL